MSPLDSPYGDCFFWKVFFPARSSETEAGPAEAAGAQTHLNGTSNADHSSP